MNVAIRKPVPLSQPPAMYRKTEPMADSQMDVTDAWNEVNDPENEEGATVTAYFAHDFDHGQTQATLIGLAVEEGGLTLYYTAAGALCQLGYEAAARIEQTHGEEL